MSNGEDIGPVLVDVLVPDAEGLDDMPVEAAEEITPAATVIGKVASPLRNESTSILFHFWVPPDVLVERTQLVRTESTIGPHALCFYGIVDEVYRRSRKRGMDEEYDTFDGDLNYEPPFGPEGVTFAAATILRTEPSVYTPPREQSPVYLGSAEDAGVAYNYGEMLDDELHVDWGLPIGVLRNGASRTLGVAKIDLRSLNGDRAGHLNVTGQAGAGTKSSLLTEVVRALLDFAVAWDNGDPHRPPFSVRPIIFNVKGRDLMYIDFPNRYLKPEHMAIYQEMGMTPQPFNGATFYAPCQPAGDNRATPQVIRPVGPERQTRVYDWTLADVIRLGLWPYLFSDETQANENMMAQAEDILDRIAQPCTPDAMYPAGMRLRQGQNTPQSFSELRDWLHNALGTSTHPLRQNSIHAFATLRAVVRRFSVVFSREGREIFDQGLGNGRPLNVVGPGTCDPLVIDIATLPPELRRFVVAAVLDQVKNRQMGDDRIAGQVYFLVLDELGIYAPRGARDPITRLFEFVAAQLRSQGIIILGAQQQASRVSETVFGNAEFKILGATSPVELESSAWSRLLTPAQKAQAVGLRPDSKMVLTDRGWMNIVTPFPAWAMKQSEADMTVAAPDAATGISHVDHDDDLFDLNLPED